MELVYEIYKLHINNGRGLDLFVDLGRRCCLDSFFMHVFMMVSSFVVSMLVLLITTMMMMVLVMLAVICGPRCLRIILREP